MTKKLPPIATLAPAPAVRPKVLATPHIAAQPSKAAQNTIHCAERYFLATYGSARMWRDGEQQHRFRITLPGVRRRGACVFGSVDVRVGCGVWERAGTILLLEDGTIRKWTGLGYEDKVAITAAAGLPVRSGKNQYRDTYKKSAREY